MNLTAVKNDSVRDSINAPFFRILSLGMSACHRRLYYVLIEILGILLLKSPKSEYFLIEMSPSLLSPFKDCSNLSNRYNTVTNMNFSCHIMRQAIFKFQLTPPPNYVMKKKKENNLKHIPHL